MLPTLPLQQSPQFARALTAYGSTLSSNDPVILQRRFGPLGTINFASRVQVDALTTRPQVINAETQETAALHALGYRQIITPAHIASWNLDAPDLRAKMHQKWRNRLVKGEKSGLCIRESVWDGTPHDLFTHADDMAKRRKYRPLSTRLLAAFAQTNPGDAVLYEAFDRGHPVGACLVLKHGNTATYQTAYSTARGHAQQAPRVLIWHAAIALQKAGVTCFDLGLVETDHGAGLARFKLGTGATLRTLGGTWLRLSWAKGALPSGPHAHDIVTHANLTREDNARHHPVPLRGPRPTPDRPTPNHCGRVGTG